MNRTVCRILIIAGFAVVSMANRSMAQQQRLSVNMNGEQRNYVIGPDGSFRINDDGSLEPVDPATDPILKNHVVVPPSGGGNMGGGQVFTGGNRTGGIGSAQSAQQMQQEMQQKMRQASEDSLRKALNCSDQEWTVLLPKIQKIQALQSAVMPGAKLRAPTAGTDTPASVVQLGARVQDYQKLNSTDNVSDAQLSQRLASVREARDKVKVDLALARKELTDVVTQRQEAILFEWGVLAD